nr:immunoglobulin heavy chain junction region [Macaca mulatta]
CSASPSYYYGNDDPHCFDYW